MHSCVRPNERNLLKFTGIGNERFNYISYGTRNITVNGQSVCLDEPSTVSDLIDRFEMTDQPCAVEVNRDLVPKQQHTSHTLSDGDQVEIVTLVGGG